MMSTLRSAIAHSGANCAAVRHANRWQSKNRVSAASMVSSITILMATPVCSNLGDAWNA